MTKLKRVPAIAATPNTPEMIAKMITSAYTSGASELVAMQQIIDKGVTPTEFAAFVTWRQTNPAVLSDFII